MKSVGVPSWCAIANDPYPCLPIFRSTPPPLPIADSATPPPLQFADSDSADAPGVAIDAEAAATADAADAEDTTGTAENVLAKATLFYFSYLFHFIMS